MYENYDLMPRNLQPSLNENGILQIMKAKYNDSISNLSNDILSKHLILFYSFLFSLSLPSYEDIRFWGFSKTLTGLQ